MTIIEDQMHQHRSIRKYTLKPIPEEVLNRILSAGMAASSSGNMQAYSIIVTKDKQLRERMLKAHFNQKMLTMAPAFLTFCADFHRMRRWLEISQAPENFDNFMSFMIAAIDAVLASQNVALAAESEGLGICYMGTTLASCGEIAKTLNCPDNVVPVVGFAIGYPAEKPEKWQRLPMAGIVHRETYVDYTDRQIEEIYQQKETSGYDRYLQDPDLRRLVHELKAENLAQIYTKVKYTRKSHLNYSKNVLDCLQEKNFLNSMNQNKL